VQALRGLFSGSSDVLLHWAQWGAGGSGEG
jgi:hypothetical protein